MNEELTIIDKQIDQMAKVFNVIPGEIFRVEDTDTLLLIQRKLEESDLKKSMMIYNEIFTKTDGVDLDDLIQSVVAYVKIKTLVENGILNFDGRSTRALIKEFKSQMVKINNIIHLSKVNSLVAEAYRKEEIKKTLVKNERFLEVFNKEIQILERIIERQPKEEIKETISVKEEVQKEKIKSEKTSKESNGVFTKVNHMIQTRQDKKVIEDKLKSEEKKKSQTQCVEIPFYDKSLVITETYDCKDIPSYVLVKRKNNIFFGLKKNVGKGSYDNSDHSLLELTEATEEFQQYMTVDLLSGEYTLKEFTNAEKKSMRMYFNFMSWCFERYLGTTITVQEYLKFKNYYNRVVITMFDLERKFRTDYYRALVLADNYEIYMESYDLSYEKTRIVENIMNEKNHNYISDLEIILEHHIVDEKAKEDILECIHKMKCFNDANITTNKEEPAEMLEKGTKTFPNFFDVKNYNDQLSVTTEDLSNIQIKIQFLNKECNVLDEALFSTSNMKRAVFDYLNRKAYIKKIGLYMNNKDIFLYSSKNGSTSVMVLCDDIRKIKNLDQGIQGKLVDFYEEKIREVMIEMAQ